MELKMMNLRDLKPYPKNAKKHPQEQIKNVAESIKEFGWQQPIVVDEQNVIIIGHCRYQAAKLLGQETVPVHVAKGLDENQVNKLRLLDNKTNESEWDLDLLLEQIPTLEFDNYEIDWGIPEEENEVEEDDFDVDSTFDEIEEPISKPGDIYQLGEHRLMCGDSTNRDDVDKLMDGATADILETDPPYNVNVSNSQGMKIENDNLTNFEFKAFINDAMGNASRVLKAGGSFYIWFGDVEDISFREACFNNGLSIRQCLIWVKNGFVLGRQDYQWQHEPCLYGWKEGAAHYFIDDHTQSTVIEDKPDINKMTKAELKAALKEMLDAKIATTVMHADKPIKNTDHPTMKPLKLLGKQIANSSIKGQTVLDLFGGSGSTLIACEQLERKCYMMEYDPKYCDVIIKRWETFTGNKAEKIN